jgi:hypothetical protein
MPRKLIKKTTPQGPDGGENRSQSTPISTKKTTRESKDPPRAEQRISSNVATPDGGSSDGSGTTEI